MSTVLDLLHGHRSIRAFAPTPVPEADLRRAVAAGQMASTSSAVQAYSVLQVADPAVRRELVPLTGDQAKVATSGAFLVVCGDTRRHRLAAERDGIAYRQSLEAFLVAVIDASLFAQNMAVAFEAMGYGICYIGALRNRLSEVDRILGIPEGVYPLFGMCVGTPAESPEPKPRLPVESVLFTDRYPDDATMLQHLDRYDAVHAEALVRRGAKPNRWSERMGARSAAPERPELAAYYRSKGASLD
jgi:nitroreductase